MSADKNEKPTEDTRDAWLEFLRKGNVENVSVRAFTDLVSRNYALAKSVFDAISESGGVHHRVVNKMRELIRDSQITTGSEKRSQKHPSHLKSVPA